ncbi:potassium transporter [Terasakiispira papahanaumokuakeensis]|uniref:Potassium transporter n=1 Tax=Terasakiispira papahanaumokuakeensis TaxID=197479 RepID=A0A1E2V9E5_9GAMM|nr:monovalent cation:proton antiporter-2 (CPA2) family protein [Terasakiispira papahanaumokuakeensis]ODC03482.1 potassium transporter [Terasakiispira papahanaumokuakeensis]
MTDYFIQAFIYLLATVVAVPLSKRLGLGAVLGYLMAGVIIGPVAGLVGQEADTIRHFAEFGVVMMLFLIGLELEPKMLWRMRARLMGLGGLQVVLTTFAFMGLGLWLTSTPWPTALTVGFILALSSTAIVLQTFAEKGLSQQDGARNAFSVLLFQDMAVIPMLALIPALALPELMDAANAVPKSDRSWVSALPLWSHAAVVVGALVLVIGGGYYGSRPLFRYVVKAELREVFTAAALMLVIGIAALMNLVGLSPALGAFLAGVVMANSEFRHELKSNIEPFKGLLMGLFFITVGAGVRFDVLLDHWATIPLLMVAVIVVKALILAILARLFGLKANQQWLFLLSMAQAGEFGFVLLSYSVQHSVLPQALGQMLSAVVALTMFLTPGLFIVYEKWIQPRYVGQANEQTAEDEVNESAPVMIAGIGRFGQIISRLLRANGYQTVVLDQQLTQVETVRRVQIKSFFGDATRHAMLEAAGIAEARVFIVAIDQKEDAVHLVAYLKRRYPHLKVLARAFDRGHNYALRDAGADWVVSETFHSALKMGGEVLTSLDIAPERAERMMAAFSRMEAEHSDALFKAWQHDKDARHQSREYLELFRQMEDAITQAMAQDEQGSEPPAPQ